MEKIERPVVLGGITVKVVTGCGNMYVQLNWYHNQLVEVFATLGHAGGCAAAEMEGLTRAITMGLKYGVPLEEYIRQLRNIRCHSPIAFPRESAAMSCPDAIAATLKKYGQLGIHDVVKLILGVNGESAESVAEELVAGESVEEGIADIPEDIAQTLAQLAREREAVGLR